jgi:cobalt-zinc-cadmium efflux system protein
VASIAIGVLVIFSSWNLVKRAVAVLMESTPSHIDCDDVLAAMGRSPGVAEVHDLHIWTITSGMDSLSAHVVPQPGSERDAVLEGLRHVLHERFAIDHITIQIEPVRQADCRTSF